MAATHPGHPEDRLSDYQGQGSALLPGNFAVNKEILEFFPAGGSRGMKAVAVGKGANRQRKEKEGCVEFHCPAILAGTCISQGDRQLRPAGEGIDPGAGNFQGIRLTDEGRVTAQPQLSVATPDPGAGKMDFPLGTEPAEEIDDRLEMEPSETGEAAPHFSEGATDDANAQRRMQLRQSLAVQPEFIGSAAHQRLEDPHLFACPVILFRFDTRGQVRQMFLNGGIERLQDGENLMADPIAGIGEIVVAFVLDMGEALAVQVVDELLPGEGEKGTDKRPVLEPHPRQTAEGAAAQETVNDGLRLIAAMMPEGNPPAVVAGGRPLKKRTAGVPTGLLQPDPPLLGHFRHGLPTGDKGQAEPLTETLHEEQILATLRTEGMIEMSDTKGQGKYGRQTVEQMKEGDGVGAAGDGDENPVPGSDQVLFNEDLVEGILHGVRDRAEG